MKSRTILGLVTVTLCMGAAWLSWRLSPDQPASVAASATPLPIGGDFTLLDHHGKARSLQDFAGKYLLVYFGYAFCPDICPTALHNISDALKQLEAVGRKKLLDRLQVVFITIDPSRDTVDALHPFMTQFHPSILALTGPQNAIDDVIKKYRVYATKVPHEGGNYLMDHSSLVYLMDPSNKCLDHFDHQTPPEEIVRLLRRSCEV
jgi:protein SCO1/2